LTRYPDAITAVAAILGLVLIGMTILRFRTAAVADVGAGLAAMLAVGVLLLSLPVISKISLSFAKDQSVALEFRSTASAENICTVNNIVTEINKPLIERIANLEQLLVRQNFVTLDALPSPSARAASRSKADVRIYYRSGRDSDAEKLRQFLGTKVSFVDAINSDLTEVGREHEAGFNRVRFEAIPSGLWAQEAALVKDLVAMELGAPVSGPDPVSRTLPGDVQILLY
jgi:hypothetical protein